MKKDLVKILGTALSSMSVSPLPQIDVEIPKVEAHGHVATPLAMGLAKTLRQPPRRIAEDIVAAIKDNPLFEKVEIAGPGFINVTFTNEYLRASLLHLLEGDASMLRVDAGNGRRALVEFVSANPTGPLHIGHARGAAVGNALCNLLQESGFSVEREFYINDAGRQVLLLGESVFARYMHLCGFEGYAFPEEGYRGDYIEDIAREFREKEGDHYSRVAKEEGPRKGIIAAREFAYSKMLDLIRKDLELFKVTPYDRWVSERSLYDKGEVAGAISFLKEKGCMYEKDGALWFRSTDFTDDKDRVVIKSDGANTYFASDIAYHKDKLDRGYDIIIDIWGADHHGYIPRIESVMRAFGYDSSRFRVILVQMVNLLKHGEPFQMSKRTGAFVALSEVVDLVGADTTKFIFLTRKSDSHLDFDIDVVTAQSAENPVYYVQYANARINSILANARQKGLETERFEGADLSPLSAPEELEIIRKLLSYPMVLEGAARSYEPHHITFFLQQLAGIFHPYYHKYKVVGDDAAVTAARLALCAGIKKVLHDALTILGVTAPERM
ncbi:MAG: arginine--tRNA ligase [Nitrospiraceae bacterium]|nr:arginine--tRNA ligase [Nitrospiraceae bacterium]